MGDASRTHHGLRTVHGSEAVTITTRGEWVHGTCGSWCAAPVRPRGRMTTIRHPSTYDSRRVRRLVSIRVVANRPGIVATLHSATLHSNSGPVVIPRLRQENRGRRDEHYHDVATPAHIPTSLVTSAIGNRSPRGFDFAAPSCMMKSSDQTTSTKERNHDRDHHT